MKFLGLFNDQGREVLRKTGFNSRSIVSYYESDRPEYVYVLLVRDGVREGIFVKCPFERFCEMKRMADLEDSQLFFHQTAN